MQHIVQEVQRVTDLIREISASTSEQTVGIGQVGEAVAQLDRDDAAKRGAGGRVCRRCLQPEPASPTIGRGRGRVPTGPPWKCHAPPQHHRARQRRAVSSPRPARKPVANVTNAPPPPHRNWANAVAPPPPSLPLSLLPQPPSHPQRPPGQHPPQQHALRHPPVTRPMTIGKLWKRLKQGLIRPQRPITRFGGSFVNSMHRRLHSAL